MKKFALVTGASSGIGLEICHSLATKGFNIILTSRSRNKLKAISDEISSNYGVRTDYFVCDLVDNKGPKKISEYCESKKYVINILVNNAGILRDKSFHKITTEEFDQVMDVHFQGSFYASHAVYPIMREQNFGRIIFTTSSCVLCRNFGQANYCAAKMGMIGLMNCLKIEGQKYNVFSSAVAPVALSRMTDSLFPEGIGERFMPEYVTPAVIYLASEESQNGAIIGAGAGVFTRFRILETMGLALGTGDEMTPENIATGWDSVSDMEDARELFSGPEQTIKILEQADKA